MMSIDDKTLMAFVDGELDAEGAEQLSKRLSSDSTARERARIFEDTANLLDDAFAPTLRGPMPKAVLRLLGSAHSEPTEHLRPVRVASKPYFSWISPRALALAASLLLVVGITGGFVASRVMMTSAQPDTHRIAFPDDSDAWQRGLDATPSGQTFAVADAPNQAVEEILPLATFIDHQGRYCRAYQRGTGGRPESMRFRGIACRTGEGSWVTRVVVADSMPAILIAPRSEPDGTYRPAAAETDDPFDRVLEAHMTTSPLSSDGEARLIERAWK